MKRFMKIKSKKIELWRNSPLVILALSALWAQLVMGADSAQPAADKLHCLTFSMDQSANRVPNYKEIYQISSDITVYSASFDLNGDGRPEYFYYVDELGGSRCGSISLQVGSCPIEVLQYTKAGSFVSINFEVDTFPGHGFKPNKHLKNYLCVRPDETGNGYELFEHFWWQKNRQDRTFWLHWAED